MDVLGQLGIGRVGPQATAGQGAVHDPLLDAVCFGLGDLGGAAGTPGRDHLGQPPLDKSAEPAPHGPHRDAQVLGNLLGRMASRSQQHRLTAQAQAGIVAGFEGIRQSLALLLVEDDGIDPPR